MYDAVVEIKPGYEPRGDWIFIIYSYLLNKDKIKTKRCLELFAKLISQSRYTEAVNLLCSDKFFSEKNLEQLYIGKFKIYGVIFFISLFYESPEIIIT